MPHIHSDLVALTSGLAVALCGYAAHAQTGVAGSPSALAQAPNAPAQTSGPAVPANVLPPTTAPDGPTDHRVTQVANPEPSAATVSAPTPEGREAQPAASAESLAAEPNAAGAGAAATSPLPPIRMAAWARVGMYANNSRRLDDAYADGVFVLLASADVNRYLKLDMGLIALFNPDIAGRAELLDGILRFELHDLFNIWAGRMLVPSDRSTFSGPWFMAAWNYPGFYPNGLTVLPRSGPFGRNDGLTAWGQVAGGKFKYYAGAYDLHDRSQAPLFSGRLVLNLLSPEPGYYNMSTYYGANILAIGLAGQAKRRGSIGPSSAAPGAPALPGPTTAYYGVNADVLFEKKLAGNVLDLEGAYYYFHGEYEPVRHGWFALASFLVGAKLGIGQVQPLVRVQRATPPSGASSTLIDAQLGYVMGGPGARLALGYQHGAVPGASSNTVFLGAQLQK